MKDLVSLGRVFAYLSLMTFGGGMAAYPELKAQTVDVHKWLTFPQLDHLYSVGQMAPGPNMMMIVAIGTLQAGALGAVVAFVAFFLPTSLIALVIGRLWKRMQGRTWVVAVQQGLAPVSVGLLLAGCLTFGKAAITGWVSLTTAAVVFGILLRSSINPAVLVLAGAVVGALAFGPW